MSKLMKIIPIIVIIAMVMSACAQATQATEVATQVPATQVPATKVPATQVPPTKVPATATQIPATEAPKIELTYWDNMDLSTVPFQDALIKEFEAAHPNITINHQNLSLNDMQVKLPTALSSGVGPDLVEADVSPQWLGTYVKSNQILSLDEAYTQYGWDQRVFQWAQDRVTYDGKRYAVGHEFETLGLMYNKKIFAELGI